MFFRGEGGKGMRNNHNLLVLYSRIASHNLTQELPLGPLQRKIVPVYVNETLPLNISGRNVVKY